MTDALIVVAVIVGVVFAANLVRVKIAAPGASTVRLVPAALLYTEAFLFRVLSIALFVVGIPLLVLSLIGYAARPR